MAILDDIRSKVGRGRRTMRTTSLLVTVVVALAVSACGAADDKTYDISPVFPLSANKCEKYDGRVEGSGISARCWVTKSECERAASDWRQAMQNVPDAVEFSC